MSELVLLLARTVAPALTSSARPGLTFAVVEVAAAVLVRTGHATLPANLAWLVTTPVVVAAVVVGVLETVASHDADVASIAREIHLTKLTTALGALASGLALSALGDAEARAAIEEGTAPVGEAFRNAESAAVGSVGIAREVAVGVGVVLSLALGWLRGRMLDWLDDLSLSDVWARFETGGVVALALLFVLLPVVALALTVLGMVALLVASAIVVAVAKARDGAARVGCSSCAARVRAEASICPRCKAPRAPSRWLAPAGR